MSTFYNPKSLIVGVDIGGSHISSAIVSLSEGCIMHGTKVHQEVNSQGNAHDIISVWANTIQKTINTVPEFSGQIGIAMPGPFDYTAGISLIKGMHKYEHLYQMNIRDELALKLSVNPKCITFKNDAEAFLQGEVFCGAAKGYTNAMGITLGTGLGSACSINGVTEDVNLGISPLHDGIAEDYISTRWFLKRYNEHTGRSVLNVKHLVDVMAADLSLGIIFSDFSSNLSLFVNNFIKLNKVDVVVIGGNITKAHHLFWAGFKNAVQQKFPDVVIKRTFLWDDAAIVGVASYHYNDQHQFQE